MDDLAKVVYHNDGRLDTVADMARHTTNELDALKLAANEHEASKVNHWLIAAAIASPIVTLIVGVIALLEHH